MTVDDGQKIVRKFSNEPIFKMRKPDDRVNAMFNSIRNIFFFQKHIIGTDSTNRWHRKYVTGLQQEVDAPQVFFPPHQNYNYRLLYSMHKSHKSNRLANVTGDKLPAEKMRTSTLFLGRGRAMLSFFSRPSCSYCERRDAWRSNRMNGDRAKESCWKWS